MKILFLSIFFLFALNMQAATFISYEYQGEKFWVVLEDMDVDRKVLEDMGISGVTITGYLNFGQNASSITQVSEAQGLKDLRLKGNLEEKDPSPSSATQVSAAQALKHFGLKTWPLMPRE